MRVLVVSREYPPAVEGGISRRLEKMIPKLLDLGVEIGVVSFGGSSIAGEKVYSLNVSSKILYTKAGEPSASDLASLINDIRRLDSFASDISKSGKYDVVQVEEPIFGPFMQTKLPKVITVHNTQIGEVKALIPILRGARQSKRLLFSGLVGTPLDVMCFQKSNCYVAVSPNVKDQLVDYYHIPSSKIVVIPNGIDLPNIDLQSKYYRLRDPNRELSFVFVGRLVDHKRVDVFLRALHILKSEKNIKFKAFVVGAGPNERELKAMSRRFSLSEQVTFTGYIDQADLQKILFAADVFVFPSVYEGWGLSIYEAAAVGCAPVVSDIPVFSSYLTNEVNALLFKPGDAQDLAKKLIELDCNRQLLSELSISARKLVESFRWNDSARKLLDLYSSLISLPTLKSQHIKSAKNSA